MKFHKSFNFKVISRVILLLLTLCIFAFIFGNNDLLFNQILLAGIIVTQVYELIKFVGTTNRELSKFIMSVKYADYSASFGGNYLGPSFKSMNASFLKVLETIKEAKIEKEAQFQFLEMMINKIAVGIISIKGNNEIYLINNEAKKLLGIKGEVKNWAAINSYAPKLAETVSLIDNHGKKLVNLQNKKELSVAVSNMKLIDDQYKLVILQDIESAIEQKEIEAWNKLIRILTHEIMNSITPITSLTDSLIRLIEEKDGQPVALHDLDEEDLDDIRISLKTIQRRSDGMLRFVDDYRRLTKVPLPKPEHLSVMELLQSMLVLMKGEMEKLAIQSSLKVKDPEASLFIDRKMIEQVLINLLTNAIHAVENVENGTIDISYREMENESVISIADNGTGIEEDKLESIFVPFFSTKEKGSGIGLSLSKQIMNQHNGTIKVTSTPGVGTTFMLVFGG